MIFRYGKATSHHSFPISAWRGHYELLTVCGSGTTLYVLFDRCTVGWVVFLFFGGDFFGKKKGFHLLAEWAFDVDTSRLHPGWTGGPIVHRSFNGVFNWRI